MIYYKANGKKEILHAPQQRPSNIPFAPKPMTADAATP